MWKISNKKMEKNVDFFFLQKNVEKNYVAEKNSKKMWKNMLRHKKLQEKFYLSIHQISETHHKKRQILF